MDFSTPIKDSMPPPPGLSKPNHQHATKLPPVPPLLPRSNDQFSASSLIRVNELNVQHEEVAVTPSGSNSLVLHQKNNLERNGIEQNLQEQNFNSFPSDSSSVNKKVIRPQSMALLNIAGQVQGHVDRFAEPCTINTQTNSRSSFNITSGSEYKIDFLSLLESPTGINTLLTGGLVHGLTVQHINRDTAVHAPHFRQGGGQGATRCAESV